MPPVVPTAPSSLYRAGLWRLGHWAARVLPSVPADGLCRILGNAYWRLNRRRRAVVVRNLLPPLRGDANKARALGRELFRQFARKVLDLWRYESGCSIAKLASDLRGWEYFQAAQKTGRGILLVTVHVGNWELGAPLLASHGVRVCVITLQEPDPALTELRKAARARWGIDTLVIGENPFAFVDVIRQLEAGATVALLMDRPPPSGAVEVELFGRPFLASRAAAELARASGCAVLPVALPRIESGYRAEVFPEIQYDRQALADRDARRNLTRQILRVFEPIIQQHLSQWYHFVPIWPDEAPQPRASTRLP